MPKSSSLNRDIVIRGAKEHNLKSVDLTLPRDQLIVMTGLSGSGKSSLAFDTIYAEGQRRYVESLSAYARQFLERMEKPDVDEIVGVAIVGRPVSRRRDDGLTLEVTRLCTDGTSNACSFLYGAAWRAARALGFKRIGTYTTPEEGGASLRAAGWRLIAETPGRSWSVPSRPRVDTHPLGQKSLWEMAL